VIGQEQPQPQRRDEQHEQRVIEHADQRQDEQPVGVMQAEAAHRRRVGPRVADEQPVDEQEQRPDGGQRRQAQAARLADREDEQHAENGDRQAAGDDQRLAPGQADRARGEAAQQPPGPARAQQRDRARAQHFSGDEALRAAGLDPE
jgi:hypothetical protein